MLMGVLNVTPDSFSDGGRYFNRTAAIKHGLEMVARGAAIIDVGGESTRPGAQPVEPNEQIERVRPVIEELTKSTGAQRSIDTSSAEVALAAETGAALILMHMQGTPATMQIAPAYDDVVREVAEFFRQQFAQAVRSGIDPMCTAFDPGIGFGKTLPHNLALLANLPRLRVEGRPLVVGVSRKSFLSKISGIDGNRENATIAMTSLLRERGAQILRVHDVAPNLQALRTTEALLAVAP
jgi:dihydropteroate synthase